MSNEITVTNDLTFSADFAVARTSKAGKTVYRGTLGILTSGNKDEREHAAYTAMATMLRNGNYRHVMREVERVFPVSFLKKSDMVTYNKGKNGAADELWFVTDSSVDGATKRELELYEGWTKANKATTLKFASAVRGIVESDDFDSTKLKGEKFFYYTALVDMLDADAKRQAAKLEAAATEGV